MKPFQAVLVAGLLLCTGISSAWADSLYQSDRFRAFAADHRAYRTGDNLTVLITEIASASSTANTATNKETALTAKLSGRNENFDLSAGLGDNFDGGGRTERTGKLLAKLTVLIESIDEHGDLRIRGAQTIDVNNERQSITLSGKVRPQDIGADNSVLSSRISDAKIEFVGDGVINEKQRPGLLTRFLSWLRIL